MSASKDEMLRALWCAAKAAGGTLVLGGPSIWREVLPKGASVTIIRDRDFGDLKVIVHDPTKTPTD
jgi:hypothetical protein